MFFERVDINLKSLLQHLYFQNSRSASITVNITGTIHTRINLNFLIMRNRRLNQFKSEYVIFCHFDFLHFGQYFNMA
jgi:hypothetical protein